MKNPFKILNVNIHSSKKEIIEQVSKTMNIAQYDLKTIAQAQKTLFHPIQRASAEFIHYINIDCITGETDTSDICVQTTFNLDILDIFNEERNVKK